MPSSPGGTTIRGRREEDPVAACFELRRPLACEVGRGFSRRDGSRQLRGPLSLARTKTTQLRDILIRVARTGGAAKCACSLRVTRISRLASFLPPDRPSFERRSFENAGHMPDSSVIADVSETLQTVLTDAFSTLAPGPPVAEVHDLQGAISTTPARMTIFLFEAIEDPTVRNQRRPREIVATEHRAAPSAGAARPALPADAVERRPCHRSPAARACAADAARRCHSVRPAAAGRTRRQQRGHQAQARTAHARGADARVACRRSGRITCR